jgi:hypothetical protein
MAPTLFSLSKSPPPPLALSWGETGLFLLTFVLVFACYLLALRVLAARVGIVFTSISTAIFGLVLLFIPIVTSQDIYSYIIYARMQVLYSLNPLTTLPTAIMGDPAYLHLYWTDQPSAYGPTWIALTSFLQWITGSAGTASLTPMLLALRITALLSHLGSVLLLWSLSGRLQLQFGYKKSRIRRVAVFAFAWNPLLLFEAGINAHNDAVLLFIILLALWCLVRIPTQSGVLCTAFLLALATCLKVNIAILFPGLLLFIWLAHPSLQARLRAILPPLLVYTATVVGLYAPFWDYGGMLVVLHVNPTTYRATNSLAEFLSHLYNSVIANSSQSIGSPSEEVLRGVSEGVFVVAYLLLCWRAYRTCLFTSFKAACTGELSSSTFYTPHRFLGLVRWMTLAWLLYCILGSPWFWPWYLVTFFGLFALLEAVPVSPERGLPVNMIRAVRVLAFSMVSLYCFYTWAPNASLVPLLYAFRWSYLRGIWAWLPCLLLFLLPVLSRGDGDKTQ